MRIVLGRLGDEFEPEHVGVEGATACQVTDRDGDMQDAFGLDHGRLLARRSTAVTARLFVNSLENLRGAINMRRGGDG